jgi:hypothetical protein
VKSIVALVALAACHGSSSQPPAAASHTIAIVGHGLRLTPAPSVSCAQIANGALMFGPRADKPLTGKPKNVLVRPGRPPAAALTAHPLGPFVLFSDGAADTTSVALGDGMTTYDAVLSEVAVTAKDGDWTLVVDGKEQPWKVGQRVDIGEDRSVNVVTSP